FFALALSVHVGNPKLGRWLTLAAAVVSVTRVMAGIHWPLDILGGLVLAIIAVSLTKFAFNLSQSELGPRSSI
ncbi:MAG: phosphatase PAP2 family protein, partial [Patescibacteria group bacterium]